jgi:DNA-directed RNA polymerase subunit RPC12/RpoP
MNNNRYLSEEDIDDFFDEQEKKDKFFICENCEKKVNINAPGTDHRNHCPYCLYSRHVDKSVGDRESLCLGLMMPIGKFLRDNGEEVLIHKCLDCGKFSNNRVAGDDDLGLVSGLTVIQEEDKQEL